MLILGIESSCDDTALALLKADEFGPRLLAEHVSSQVNLHIPYGGVVPELAAREHLRALPYLFSKVLQDGGVSQEEIDLIAVTRGPGLKGCLLMGIGFAKGLAVVLGKPVIGVHHIEGHILAPMLESGEGRHGASKPLDFPYLGVCVSGGHTEIHLVEGVGKYSLLSRTIDDAAGEAFDKSAYLLGYAYPGGAALAKVADDARVKFRDRKVQFQLPKVMTESDDFSFSGLKTAISLLVRRQSKGKNSVGVPVIDETLRQELAQVIQESIVGAIAEKVRKAVTRTGVTSVALTGGVSANSRLREVIAGLDRIQLSVVSKVHCTDNAAMIAYVGWKRYNMDGGTSLAFEPLPYWLLEDVGRR